MFHTIWLRIIEFMYLLKDVLDLTSPWRVFVLVMDLAIVLFIAYYIIRILRQTRAKQIVKGILMLVFLVIIAKVFNMVILNFILTNFVTYGVILLIVVFQPEIRNVFEKLGRSKLVGVFDMDDNIMVKHSISEIVKAVEIMSLKKIGALIVIERNTKVSEVLKEGINLSAKVSSELIQNIFMPRTPLHDGAIVIDKSEILAAKCILPLASEVSVPKNLGTRHRAAVGITEISDALVIVVSEETGIISLVENGKLRRELTGDTLKELLLTKLDRTKTAVNIKNIVKK
ncbi:MAG: diadenylate cyclase CdaA [Christensenellales bacterium]|jgi:diadenylate cyclase